VSINVGGQGGAPGAQAQLGANDCACNCPCPAGSFPQIAGQPQSPAQPAPQPAVGQPQLAAPQLAASSPPPTTLITATAPAPVPQQPVPTVASPPVAGAPTLTVPALQANAPPTAVQPTPVAAQPQLAGGAEDASGGDSGDGPPVGDITLANGGVLPLQSAVTVPLQGRAIKFEGRWFHIGPVAGVDMLT
jgi:hypothetical protein